MAEINENNLEQEGIILKEGNSYLINTGMYGDRQEVYVEKIAKTAYKFRKQATDGTWYINWEGKKYFNSKNILEFLTSWVVPPTLPSEETYKIEINKTPYLVICGTCYGRGVVSDPQCTAGETTCPECWGSGHIMKYPE